jgi:hypothetical protein
LVRGDLLGRPDGDDLDAAVSALRPQVDDPIRRLDDVEVVLDHDHGVALVAEAVQDVEQMLDVVKVQADSGFVEDIEPFR